MNMQPFDAHTFLQDLGATLQHTPDAPLPPEVYTLLEHTPAYRGALLLLVARMLDLPAPPPPGKIAAWFDDLDAFFDLEMQQGIKAAAASYPHVWWALWEDDECLATYRALREIEHAVQSNTLKPLQLFPIRLVDVWNFSRHVLAQMLPSSPQLRPVFRGADDETVLGQQPLALGDGATAQVTLSVQPVSDNAWSLIARMVPPQAGWLVLTLGDQLFRARFDGTGTATIAPIAADQLNQEDGPPLQVLLELEHA